MSFVTEVQNEVLSCITSYGTPIKLQYFTLSGGSAVYDDAWVPTQSGTDVWSVGFKQEFNSPKGSTEAQWVEQGKLMFHDSRLYIPGTVNTSGMVMVTFGSPTATYGETYKILDLGIAQSPHLGAAGDAAYKKVFIRILSNGSFYGQ